jgi:hypothetical protein
LAAESSVAVSGDEQEVVARLLLIVDCITNRYHSTQHLCFNQSLSPLTDISSIGNDAINGGIGDELVKGNTGNDQWYRQFDSDTIRVSDFCKRWPQAVGHVSPTRMAGPDAVRSGWN